MQFLQLDSNSINIFFFIKNQGHIKFVQQAEENANFQIIQVIRTEIVRSI